MEDKKLSLSIGSELSQVQLVGKTVRCLCEDLSLANTNISQVELAVVEAINNSIEHAYSFEKGFKVDVLLEVNCDVLNVVIMDYGIPMPPNTVKMFTEDEVKMPDFSSDADSLPESGWGVQLVKSLCDSMSYKRERACNMLSLSFELERAAA